MSIAASIQSMFAGHKAEGEMGSPLDKEMIQRIREHSHMFSVETLSQCTVTRMDSDYTNCKYDLEIHDATGKLILRGREFRSGRPGFWEPSDSTEHKEAVFR